MRIFAAIAALLCACGGAANRAGDEDMARHASTPDLGTPAALYTRLSISPSGPSIGVDGTKQMTATAVNVAGQSVDVTDIAIWGTDDGEVATVDASGLVTAITVGFADVSATLGSLRAVTTVVVNNSLKTVTTSFPIPTQAVTISADQVNAYPIFVPSYATNVQFLVGNLLTSASGGLGAPTLNYGIFQSVPGNSNRVGAGVTGTVAVPADGISSLISATGVSRGADGQIVLALGTPNGGGGGKVVACPLMHHGWQIDATTTVSPLGTPSSESVQSLYWILMQYDVPGGKTVTVSLDDSIGAGATTGSNAQIRSTGYVDTAMFRIGVAQDACIAIFAQPGGKMDHWVTTGAGTPYVRLWAYVAPMFADGARAWLPIGTNDTPDGAAAMDARLAALVGLVQAAGASAWSAPTIMPASVYVTDQEIPDRLTHNGTRRLNALGFTDLFGGGAVPDAFVQAADPWDQTVINRGDENGAVQYDIDGTHLATAGQIAREQLILGTYTPIPHVVSIFDTSSVVPVAFFTGGARECGLGFDSYNDGEVAGVWWYKHASETGTHTVRLWTTAGVKLAEKIMSGETASGWQLCLFDSPVIYAAFTQLVVTCNYNAQVPDGTGPPFTLQIFRNDIRAFTNNQSYTEGYSAGLPVSKHYDGGSFFGTSLGVFPPALSGSGEQWFLSPHMVIP